jgi:hypothetical protein
MRKFIFQPLNAVLVFSLISFCSCDVNYYKPRTINKQQETSEFLNSANAGRYFILRTPGMAYAMNNIKLSLDKKQLHFIIDSLPGNHKLHLFNGATGNLDFSKKRNEENIINEVHIYKDIDQVFNPYQPIMISIDSISKIEILQLDRKRRNDAKTSIVISTIAAILISGLLIGAAIF